ncbi:HAD-IIB family hydrolase [Ruminococcus sp.]|uniref:HAD-IIB family hydrolase n=1 Tax=Ruminococcus sp. TaxID=41978 RepID=UPI0025E54490|nr:HAD-IIB family hydrolase [Ruminococcus sp.]MCR4637866.1 HAD-IIB family hydrolase [Ruminococcus sp.]
MRSIIFFDIDGTLVTEDARAIIPQSTCEAIKLTRQKGNLTFINSGRTAFNISSRVKELGFDGYICGCGTYIEYNGEVIFSRTIPQIECRNIAELMRKCNVTPVYEHSEGYFFDDKAPITDGLKEFMEVFVDSGIDISGRVEDYNFGFDKFVIWVNPDSDMELFRREVGKSFSIIDRGGGFYENVPLGYSKATGIEMVLNKLGISINNAYAIGDSMNDLPMLEAVPNSIAMGGAERIYPYVKYITSNIEEDGIKNALLHFNLI